MIGYMGSTRHKRIPRNAGGAVHQLGRTAALLALPPGRGVRRQSAGDSGLGAARARGRNFFAFALMCPSIAGRELPSGNRSSRLGWSRFFSSCRPASKPVSTCGPCVRKTSRWARMQTEVTNRSWYGPSWTPCLPLRCAPRCPRNIFTKRVLETQSNSLLNHSIQRFGHVFL